MREAQFQLGLEPRKVGGQQLPLRYRLLAAQAYEGDQITEGELARLLRTDRASARRIVQELTHTLHLESKGDIASLPIDLAGSLIGRDQ